MKRDNGQKKKTSFERLAAVTLVMGIVMVSGRSLAAPRTWDGGGADSKASTAANWSDDTAPVTGDDILLDSGTDKNMTWDLNLSVQSWTQVGYTGTVTVATVYPGQGALTNFTITGDCVISNGVWTQTPNPLASDVEQKRLRVSVGGNLFLGSNGAINVTSMGYYGSRKGPGAAPGSNAGASHGGRGKDISNNEVTLGYCYGSVFEPTNLGSSGRDNAAHCTGGGAIRLTVGETLYHDGVICANANEALNAVNLYAGAGGSVWLTVGNLVGDGVIQANGNKYPGASGARGGGGGRVAVVLTNSAADFSSFTGSIQAYGGLDYGAAGTVYLQRGNELAGRGEIIIDNDNRARSSITHATEFLHPPRMPAITAATLRIRNNAFLTIATNYTLNISGVWSNSSAFLARSDSRVVFTDQYSSTNKLYGNSTFMGFVCTNGGQTLVFETNTTTTVAAGGKLDLYGSETATNLLLRPSAPAQSWNLNVDIAAEHSVRYVDVTDSDARSGSQILAMFSQDGGNNSNWVFNAVAGGATNVWTGEADAFWRGNGNWSLGRAPFSNDTIRIPSGTPADPVVDSRDRTVAGLNIEAGASLSLNGFNFTVEGTSVVAGSLVCGGSETVMFRGTATVSGAITAAGTETFVLEADADFTGGTFAAAQSTVLLSGTAPQMIDPAGLSFHNIEIATTSAVVFVSGFAADDLSAEADASTRRQVSFAAGKMVSLQTVTLFSTFGTTNIVLRSSADGQVWGLNVSVWATVRGVDVKDSDASAGRTISAFLSRDSGGNTNWDFASPWALWTGQTGNGLFGDANNWWPETVPGPDSHVRVDTLVPMTIAAAVTISNLTVGGGNLVASVTVNSALTVQDTVVIGNNGTLEWNRPGVVSNDLLVLSGGVLTHTENAATEVNKLDLDVDGDVIIFVNGVVDVSGRGYRVAYSGPGGSSGYEAGSHGGRGASIAAGHLSTGPCYGSIVAPANLGSCGNSSSCHGGGAIRLTVKGTLMNDGLIAADSPDVPNNGYIGSGGSVLLTASRMAGFGSIRANGGYGRCGGGGGRLALVVTDTGADFSTCTGLKQAFGGTGYGGHGAAGTIYLQQASDRPGRGLVMIANTNRITNPGTDVPSFSHGVAGESDRAEFHIADGSALRLTDDFTVGDIWLDTANAVLDLADHTLTVNARKHSLGLGSVENEGAIVWTGLRPGVLIILR